MNIWNVTWYWLNRVWGMRMSKNMWYAKQKTSAERWKYIYGRLFTCICYVVFFLYNWSCNLTKFSSIERSMYYASLRWNFSECCVITFNKYIHKNKTRWTNLWNLSWHPHNLFHPYFNVSSKRPPTLRLKSTYQKPFLCLCISGLTGRPVLTTWHVDQVVGLFYPRHNDSQK